jgi:diguanylate cyclase (GGDEF)-like protein
VLAAVALALAVAAYANLTLHQRGQAQQETSALLSELDLRLHEDSDLLWKTLADRGSPVRIAREVGTIRAREHAIVDLLGRALPAGTVATLERQIADYHGVLDRELELLGIAKTTEALALEQQQTDPLFLRLSAAVAGLTRQAEAAARTASTIANTALILALLLASTAIGWLLARFERAHLAATRAGDDLLAQQQLALLQAKESEALIKHQAMHDALTGLPNRLLFAERVAAADGQLTMLLIDLDDFKGVNDTHGHAAGDELLVQVAQRLRGSIRDSDLAARLGGDEFAVVLAGTCADTANALAERVLAALAAPYRVAGGTLGSRGSVGVAVGHGPGSDSEQLLHEADLAMYHAKRTGKGSYAVYQPGMLTSVAPRRRSTDEPRTEPLAAHSGEQVG